MQDFSCCFLASGPGDKGSRATAEGGEAEGGSQEDMEAKDVSFPPRKGAHRGPALSSLKSFSRRYTDALTPASQCWSYPDCSEHLHSIPTRDASDYSVE